MASEKNEEKYTKPDLREKIKEEIKRSDKGGKKGQWSARKSQLLVKEYEKQGGGYTGEKDEAAKSLEDWTAQDWQTQGGEVQARENGKTKRYLPKEAWDKLSAKEKREAEKTKQKGSQKGEQYVAYTPAVKKALKQVKSRSGSADREASKQELYNQAKKLDIRGRSRMSKPELAKAIQQAKK
jgi:hypothetical protein